jgi:hypothetical protein
MDRRSLSQRGAAQKPMPGRGIFDGSIFLPAADQDPRNTRASRINIHEIRAVDNAMYIWIVTISLAAVRQEFFGRAASLGVG